MPEPQVEYPNERWWYADPTALLLVEEWQRGELSDEELERELAALLDGLY